MADPKPMPGTGALYGKQHEPREIARHAYNAGWKDPFTLTTAVAVCLAESQGYDRAIHVNLDGTEDRGAWQLNSIHKDITDTIAYDLIAATDEAYTLYKARGGFGDWAAYTSRVYLHDSYIGRATRGVGNFIGEELLAVPVPPRTDGALYEHAYTTPILEYSHRLAGMKHYVDVARRDLGWQAATKTKVDMVQRDLANAQIAAKAALPSS